jgi:hypothetical protein
MTRATQLDSSVANIGLMRKGDFWNSSHFEGADSTPSQLSIDASELHLFKHAGNEHSHVKVNLKGGFAWALSGFGDGWSDLYATPRHDFSLSSGALKLLMVLRGKAFGRKRTLSIAISIEVRPSSQTLYAGWYLLKMTAAQRGGLLQLYPVRTTV